MNDLTLIIGNKNYSSWSMRPWLALQQFAIPYTEQVIPLFQDDWKAAIAQHSPSGKVPVLKHGDRTVWDSLAILEYLAEQFPDKGVWPRDTEARGVARSISAEMHAGFPALRECMPMNLRKSLPGKGMGEGVKEDIERITGLWRDCRRRFGKGGAFLCGDFSAADAMYAPVVTRFVTYGVALDDVCQSYVDAVLALPTVQRWYEAARSEPWIIERVENV